MACPLWPSLSPANGRVAPMQVPWGSAGPSSTNPAPAGRILRDPAPPSGAGCLFRVIQRYPALSSGAGWPNRVDPAPPPFPPSLPLPFPFPLPFSFLLFSSLPSLPFPFPSSPLSPPLPPPRPAAAEKNFGVLDRPWRRWMAQSGRSQRHPAPDPALDRTAGSPLWCWMVLDRPNREDPALIDVSRGIDGNGRVAPPRGPWSLRRGAG